jgi:1,4-alpha-glucan branching enzyme
MSMSIASFSASEDLLQEEGVDLTELERRLTEGEEAEAAQAQHEADNPEDFWSPVSDPLPPGTDSVDHYGTIQPVPAHDGTECLKWDDSLWSHADHFKVRRAAITTEEDGNC